MPLNSNYLQPSRTGAEDADSPSRYLASLPLPGIRWPCMNETSSQEHTHSKPITVILNADSGNTDKQEAHQLLADTFAAHGIKVQMMLAKSGAELVELAQRAVASDCQIIVAGGGDGTINAVATALVGTDKTLGVLPLGTLNHFAKDLGIPLDLAAAVRTIIAGRTGQVDVGEVNGLIFLNNSSLGLYPTIVRQRERRQQRGYGKWTAFVWASLKVLRRYPFLNVRLSVEGKEIFTRTPFVFIGNNEYETNSLNIGSRSCLNNGQLSLYVTHDTGRVGLLRIALRALLGRLRNTQDFVAMCTTEVWVKTRHRRERVSTDGEVTVLETPLHYRVRPGALRVLLPANEQETQEKAEVKP